MRVLQTGRVGDAWKIEHACTAWGNGGKGCGAVLEVEFGDLRWYKGVPGDTWGSRDPAVVFKCPCCGALTDLGRVDWPKGYHSLTPWSKAWQDAPAANLNIATTDADSNYR